MSLPTKSDLVAYNADGGIYGTSKSPNDVVVLNIYENNQLNNEDRSTELNETEANLKLNDIYNNKIIKKSVMQRPNNILFYDNVRDNRYPLSDNFRNQLNSNDKNLNPINNINNNAINEVVIHQNNYPQNYNVMQQNIENAPPMFNDIVDTNNNVIPNNQNQNEDFKEEEFKEFDYKKCCKKVCKIIGKTLLILLLIPLAILCIYALVAGGGGGVGGAPHDAGDCDCNCLKNCKDDCDCSKCKKKRIRRVR